MSRLTTSGAARRTRRAAAQLPGDPSAAWGGLMATVVLTAHALERIRRVIGEPPSDDFAGLFVVETVD